MVRMTTTMSIKIDDNLKRRAQETAAAIGIPLSTLINAYLREVVATGRIEFSAPEQMTAQMERVIESAEKEIADGDTYGPFNSAEEMLASLHEKASIKE